MAQKNTLRFVILGLLSKEDLSGYDMKKRFEGEIGDFWYSNHSQIYPELRKMEEAGLVKPQTQIVGQKMEKKSYHMTDAGREALLEWLQKPLGALLPSRDEFAMKLYLIDDPADPEARRLFQEEIIRHEEKLAYLKTRWTVLFASEEDQSHHFGHAAVLLHAIQRETQHLRWVKKTLRSLPNSAE